MFQKYFERGGLSSDEEEVLEVELWMQIAQTTLFLLLIIIPLKNPFRKTTISDATYRKVSKI